MDNAGDTRHDWTMNHLDVPPAWLLLHALAAWIVAWLEPWGLSFGGAWADLAAGLLMGGGVLLIVVAVMQMRRHRTAVMPRQEASTLMTTGVFRRSRNPIYLGMALLLLGWILRLDAPFALPLVPLFVWLVERRFILGEEAMLARNFGPAWERYRGATRRWL